MPKTHEKTKIPTFEQVGALAPGFMPYIVAKDALEKAVASNKLESQFSSNYKTTYKAGRIVKGLKALSEAQASGTLQPPLPDEFSEMVDRFVSVIDDPIDKDRHVTLGELAIDGKPLAAAVLMLELCVAHGYSNFGTGEADS